MADGLEDTKVLPASSHSLGSAPSSARLRAPSLRRLGAYTEDESVAILDAERSGKPHRFPERETQRNAPSVEPSVPEAEAAAKGAQLTFWADDKRAMPTQFVASALFPVVQPKDAGYLDGVVLASGQALTINYKGKRLTQVHADVWQGIMHLARRAPEETPIRFQARAFLRMIGRGTGKSQRDQLHEWITDLQATSLEVLDTGSKRVYLGSLLPEGGRDQATPQDRAYVVKINRGLCTLFEAGFATINWDQRMRLRGKHNAQWLQHYFSWSKKPVPIAELHRLSGSAASLTQYKRNLRDALADLEVDGAQCLPTTSRKRARVASSIRCRPTATEVRSRRFPLSFRHVDTDGLKCHTGIESLRKSAMTRSISPSEIPEEVARFAEAQVAAGRFASIADVLLASKEALEQREAYEDRVQALRRAGEAGLASLQEHGPQLESDDEFDAFMDEAEAEALRQ